MTDQRFDALVIGAGPAGSIAALVLARAGVRVALVDKAAFPRDKACGDLIGPRGVQLLRDLALDVPEAVRVGDMYVVGPTGKRVRLPATPGRTYPGYGIVVQRSRFDATLQTRRDRRGRGVLQCPCRRAVLRRRSPRRVLAVVDHTRAGRRDHRGRRRDEPRRGSRPGSWRRNASCGVSPCAPTAKRRWSSPTSCCGRPRAEPRSRATAGCSPPATGE